MTTKQIECRIEELEAIIERVQYNLVGELLASYGGRTTAHANDSIFLKEYEDELYDLKKKLKSRKYKGDAK